MLKERLRIGYLISEMLQRKKKQQRLSLIQIFGTLLKQREEFILKFSKDESGFNCKYINEAFEEVTGCSSDDIFEKGLGSVIHPDDVPMVERALTNAFDGKTVSELFRYKIPNSMSIKQYISHSVL